MKPQRLEAFTDGVVAIIITITVLEIKIPAGHGASDLIAALPVLGAYALAFTNVGIYWNNHHHMLHAVEHIDGRVMWANLFLLFWLSLAPFVIEWMDESHFASLPTAAYGFIMGFAGLAYLLLQTALIAVNGGRESRLARSIGDDWKGKLSFVGYMTAIGLAFWQPLAAIGVYVAIAAMWFAPDRRIERSVAS